MGWNKDVYDGVSDQCGPFKPFTIWNKHVDDRKYDKAWELFIDQYDIPVGSCPTGKAQRFFNKYFQSKYGCFTCHGSHNKYGGIDFDFGLIEKWEKPKEIKRQWDQVVMAAIYNKDLTWDEMETYRKDYTKSKTFVKYKGSNKMHEDFKRLENAKELKAKQQVLKAEKTQKMLATAKQN